MVYNHKLVQGRFREDKTTYAYCRETSYDTAWCDVEACVRVKDLLHMDTRHIGRSLILHIHFHTLSHVVVPPFLLHFDHGL